MILSQQVRRPLVGVALSVAAGLTIQRCAGGSPLLLLSITAFVLAAACRAVFYRQTTVLIYIAFGLLAATHSAIEKMPAFSRSALPAAEVNFHEQELTGTIEDEPAVSDAAGTVSFLFHAAAVNCAGERRPADAVLRVYLKDPAAPVRFGEQWRLKGRYTGYENPRGGADGVLSASGENACRIKPAQDSFAERCYEVRRCAASLLRPGVEAFSEQTQLLYAMLLGYRQAIPPDLYQLFTRTGTLHIFAISGQHVVILAAIFIAGLKIFGLSRPRWGLLLMPVLFLYIFTTGLQPSALRALTMAAVFFMAPLAGRRPDAPSSIALATILLLALQPANIGDPGFLLSFVVVCGLIMVHGWAVRQLSGLRLAGWDATLKKLSGSNPAALLLRSTGMLMLTSLAAWLFSAPITALFFNTLSPVALIGNLAVIPLTFMIMLAGCLALLGGVLFLPLAALFNQANLFFISLLIWIVHRLAALPGACRAVRAPSVPVTALWYAGLVLFFAGPVRWRKGALVLVFLSAMFWGAEHFEMSPGIKILREGDSIMALRLPGSRWVLVTDGNSFSTGRTIRRLQKEGINRLHALVVTDALADAGAIRQLQDIFRPAETQTAGRGKKLNWPVNGGVVCLSPVR
ncbi:MAG TPA: ComEC/Rec2 family competence protein [Pontiellaceae bacterium]|nr:ComEC/Rec2 family competence protein [Pontiellaceae bacterium]HPR82711.1 ComEC/Rec2 family competence protein [Pontiellaceae bacterium]